MSNFLGVTMEIRRMRKQCVPALSSRVGRLGVHQAVHWCSTPEPSLRMHMRAEG